MPGPGFYWIDKEEEEEVVKVIRSRYLFRYGDEKDPNFLGKTVEFEKTLTKKFGARFGLALSSGTAALITALSALQIGPGDEVIVPGYTFIASISSVIMAGAVPVLAEVDESLTLDPEDVERKITDRTKAVMAVHMLGNPCDISALKTIAEKHNVFLIEDAAQAFGARYHGKYVGTIGDIGTYSFNMYKVINAGDGGFVITDNKKVYETAFSYHDQGHLPKRAGVEVGKRSIIGHNFRITELASAFLLAQLRKLDKIREDLHRIKKSLKQKIEGTPGIRFRRINDPEGECATILTVLFKDPETARKAAKKLGTKTVAGSGWHVYSNMEQILGKKQISAGPPFRSREFQTAVEYRKGMLPATDDILSRAINISIGVVDPGLGTGFGVHPRCTEEEISACAEELTETVPHIHL